MKFLLAFVAGLFFINISIAAAQTQSPSQVFSRNLTIGDTGADVSALQQALINDGFLAISKPTGRFSSSTADALASWQVTVGLPTTGYFGVLSRAAMAPSVHAVPAASAAPSVSAAPAASAVSVPVHAAPASILVAGATSTFSRNLTIGASGADVSVLQSTLIAGGFLAIPNPTGYFGPLTSAAVVKWQASVALPATGYFGVLSRAAFKTLAPGTVSQISPSQTSSPTPGSISTSTPAPAPTSAPLTANALGSDGGGGDGSGDNSPSLDVTSDAAALSAQRRRGDTTPPAVSISYPANNATISGAITVNANASDNVGVTEVDFYLDNIFETTEYSTPYTWSLNTLALSNATHLITAKAHDAAGNVSTANTSVKVNNVFMDTIPPVISITGPANNATVSSTISVFANASDNVGVAKTEFYLDGVLQKTLTTSPYLWSWRTASSTNGLHTLLAKAYDAAGNIGITGSLSIKVDNSAPVSVPVPDTTPPAVSISFPVNNSTVFGVITAIAPALDNIGIAKVEFFLDGILKTTELYTPYTWDWNTASSTNATHSIIAKAYDAAGNTSSASASVQVNNVVPDTTPPIISITSPLANGAVSGTVSLAANATDNLGVVKVEFYVDATLKGTDTAAPYTFLLNTTTLTAGAHSLSAKAYDAAGNIGTGVSVPITVLLSAPPASTSTSQSASSGPNYNFGFSDGGLMYYGQSDLMTRLEGMKAVGIGWVRFDFRWDMIQPSNSSTYDWQEYDWITADLKTLGLKGLGIIDYTPAWARPASCKNSDSCAPADPAQYAAFAAAAAQRYAPQGMHTWEIWNEPNLPDFWLPTPSAVAYAPFLEAAYTAIKQKDSSAVILSGGLARSGTGDNQVSPVDFLTGLYAAGAKSSFDAVALHPYSFPWPPSYTWQWNPWYQIAGTTPSLRSVMTANGDSGKQIWLTEYGAPTGGPGILATADNYLQNLNIADHVTEAFQAQMFSEAISIKNSMSYTGPLFFYTYQDSGTSESDSENFFGVIRNDGTTKPAYTTLKGLLAQ